MKDEPFKRETEHVDDLDNKMVHQAMPLDSSIDKGNHQRRMLQGDLGKRALLCQERIRSGQMMPSNLKGRGPSQMLMLLRLLMEEKNYKEDLVGCRIKVWWPLDYSYASLRLLESRCASRNRLRKKQEKKI